MKDWKDRKVLITGISGFIGSALKQELFDLGATVIGLTRDNFDHGCKTYRGDICDFDLLRGIISYEEIDTIYHLAANAIVRVSAKDPVSTYQTNVMGTVALLEAARVVGGVDHIIVASSDKAYGDHYDLPYTENHALQPKHTYDTSKACMDMISQTYRHNYNMPIVVTRCSNVYGPGDKNVSRIIPNTIRRNLKGQPALVYTDVSRMEREFIYIYDVVQAYILLGSLDLLTVKPALNIGGTGMISIYDLVKMISEQVGVGLKPIVEERDPRFKEIQKQCINANYLKSLGWNAFHDLEQGLRKTIMWYKGYFGL